MQRELIARGDRLDEYDPVLLGYANLGLIDTERIAQGSRLRFTLVLGCNRDESVREQVTVKGAFERANPISRPGKGAP